METSKTSSTVVVVDIGEHLFKVEKHSLLTGANASIKSETFRVGGHDWAIAYYPNGDASIVMSMFIYLMSATESEVTASFSLCLQDRASPVTGEKNKTIFTKTFLPAMNQTGWGVRQFMSKDDLAASGCLEDDCLWIKCTVDISQLIVEDDDDHSSSITVPPSNLSTDVRSIIESGLKADLTVKIGNSSRSFNANVCVLRARSPVFREKLRDSMSMIESKKRSICIDDIDAKVFEVLLHYIYNNCLPGFMEEATEEATSMARDLLVAAHGYGIQRLRVMCESRLSQSLDVQKVSSTLDLAEQYQCQQLKESCLKYMAKDGQRLRAIKKTEGFKQLIKIHPVIVGDILHKVCDKLN
jgi:speckle-type POZ protein